MAGVKQDQVPQTVGFLEVSLTGPRMSGFAGPAWPRTCTIYVAIADEVVACQTLPFDFDKDDFKTWRLAIRIPVASNWPDLSLDIFVERADFLFRRRTNMVVVTRGGPHTSGHTAVISRARVRLLDALVLRDMDDEEEEEEKKMKRRRNEVVEGNPRLLEGTMPFGKVVKLLDWELPAPGDEYGNPRAVVRGTVDVRINLRPPFF
ncbi:unnamed protein product [Miscanthus lutarioriparius]|uniref:Uncharacterized protein n=1 Tax=Miscanthus lutarioriparius TaxID=422564 RepID=A0A811MD06_9POAL|nr:unnamed protein product [Miscanthus lutarioriparius]